MSIPETSSSNQATEGGRRVAILGGGITGLAAAWYLQQQARWREIHLFERQSRIGGVIDTQRVTIPSRVPIPELIQGQSLIECGADNFATLVPDALQWIEELGLRQEMIQPNQEHRFARVVRAGKLWPIPQGFSLMQPTRLDAILSSRVLSIPGRLRVLWEYFVPARRDSSDESLKDFASRRLGREAFEKLVEPIVGGIFTARADRLSMQAALPQFVNMEREHGGLIRGFLAQRRQAEGAMALKSSGARYDQFLAPRQGMRWWLEAIRQRLTSCQIHFDWAVDRLERSADGWRVYQADRQERFDAVVVALPAHEAARVLASSHPRIAQEVGQIRYASSAVVAMVVPKAEVRTADRCFGIVVPSVERRDVLAISMTSEKYPGRVASDQLLLRAFMGGGVRPELMEETDDTLKRIALREVRSLLQIQSEPLWEAVLRWKESMPQYDVGHIDRVARIDALLEQTPGLVLAGNAYRGVGIPQCIRSAKAAVQKL
jgi:oxygen-dependent protoporphyrinogen oxidase